MKKAAQLDDFIKKSAEKRQTLQEEIKAIDEKIATLSATTEQVHTVTKYRQTYQVYKKDPNDKAFAGEHKAGILLALAYLKNRTLKFQIPSRFLRILKN